MSAEKKPNSEIRPSEMVPKEFGLQMAHDLRWGRVSARDVVTFLDPEGETADRFAQRVGIGYLRENKSQVWGVSQLLEKRLEAVSTAIYDEGDRGWYADVILKKGNDRYHSYTGRGRSQKGAEADARVTLLANLYRVDLLAPPEYEQAEEKVAYQARLLTGAPQEVKVLYEVTRDEQSRNPLYIAKATAEVKGDVFESRGMRERESAAAEQSAALDLALRVKNRRKERHGPKVITLYSSANPDLKPPKEKRLGRKRRRR